MNPLRLVGRLCFVVPLALAIACSGGDAKPTKWTLWYIPHEPKPGVNAPVKCRTYVFASSPKQGEFAVAVFQGWDGSHVPPENRAQSRSGEEFTGALNLGKNVIHDDSTGYDMDVNVEYLVPPYLTAKARADSDCPGPQPTPSAPKPPAKKTPAPH